MKIKINYINLITDITGVVFIASLGAYFNLPPVLIMLGGFTLGFLAPVISVEKDVADDSKV